MRIKKTSQKKWREILTVIAGLFASFAWLYTRGHLDGYTGHSVSLLEEWVNLPLCVFFAYIAYRSAYSADDTTGFLIFLPIISGLSILMEIYSGQFDWDKIIVACILISISVGLIRRIEYCKSAEYYHKLKSHFEELAEQEKITSAKAWASVNEMIKRIKADE